MIKYENIEVDNVFTEGFELSLPSATSIAITAGMFSHAKTQGIEVVTFPSIEFDVEGDAELSVQYDVYLLSKAGSDGFNVEVNRTELGMNTLALYEGDGELQHVLLSFTLPPNTNDLNGIELNVRNIVQTPKEEDTNEVPTEE